MLQTQKAFFFENACRFKSSGETWMLLLKANLI
uniref:Uncharacterized protein n=1 Tax=Arundo donax TaxID=35708 RepID=A0A0A9BUS6_ARUDO